MSDPNAQLTQSVSDLQAAISDEVAEMDANFTALQQALAANNPTAVNDAIGKIQTSIQTLKDASARDLNAPPSPTPSPTPAPGPGPASVPGGRR